MLKVMLPSFSGMYSLLMNRLVIITLFNLSLKLQIGFEDIKFKFDPPSMHVLFDFSASVYGNVIEIKAFDLMIVLYGSIVTSTFAS